MSSAQKRNGNRVMGQTCAGVVWVRQINAPYCSMLYVNYGAVKMAGGGGCFRVGGCGS